VAAVLVLGGCGEAEPQPESKPDAAGDRLSAACTDYREAVSAELPPAAPGAYPAYMAERLQHAERLIAAVREQPEGEARARLLAAGSEILSQLSDMQQTTKASFAGVMYTRLTPLEDAERRFDAAAEKAGVDCGAPDGPTEFATRAGEVCDAAGRTSGLPARDAELIRARVEGHAELSMPPDAGALERDTLAAQRELARVAAQTPASPTIRDADARYIALAGRTSAGWSRQLVAACVDLPLYEE
jgi:hypothetical protein